jgi:hypothetical protein
VKLAPLELDCQLPELSEKALSAFELQNGLDDQPAQASAEVASFDLSKYGAGVEIRLSRVFRSVERF